MVRRLGFILLAALFLVSTPAFSDDDAYLRLSRISYLEGDVSTQRLPDVDWSAASINLPLEPGDRIYTGRNGRVEIEFDDDSVLRLAENTDIEILALDDRIIQVRMLLGRATLTVASGVAFEINTPAAAFNATKKGSYRFEVNEDGDTDAIVRKGRIEAANSVFSRTVESGTRLRVRSGGDALYSVARYEERDAWDEWNDRRTVDRRAYASRRYLPSTVYIGAGDLDRYGRWVNVSNYGWGWVPHSVDAHWSPYSVGRWCYRPYFGWTWVSYEPWGWLPYHYGRWYRNSSFGWVWLPGPAFSFNFWSPGLVAFYSGPTWVSWIPLGPRDYYNVRHYHYHRGIYGHQLDQLRGLHTRAPGDHFNRNARGAVRTVKLEHFRNGSLSAGTRWSNIDRPWREGTLRDRIDVRPTRASYRPAPEREFSRPENRRERPVVVRNEPRRDAREGSDRERFRPITRPETREWSREGDERIPVAGRDGGQAEAREASGRGRTDRQPPERQDEDKVIERLQTPRTVDREGNSGRTRSAERDSSRGEARADRAGVRPTDPEKREPAAARPERRAGDEVIERLQTPRTVDRERNSGRTRSAERDSSRGEARADRAGVRPAAPEKRDQPAARPERPSGGVSTTPAASGNRPAQGPVVRPESRPAPQAAPASPAPRVERPAAKPQAAPRSVAPRETGGANAPRRIERSFSPSTSGQGRSGGTVGRGGSAGSSAPAGGASQGGSGGSRSGGRRK
ncbi:MAG: FecR domain-containing protein [Acidobacteriota bacterium]|nr:FecR domain-containing protein [Acidobacteriota bacterium]